MILCCPFCKGTKTKVDFKTSSPKYDIKYNSLVYRATASVRCNVCHARGPTCSDIIPWASRDKSKIKSLEELAISKWNNR